MSEIDVCIVAGRRPDLLQASLATFAPNLLAHFAIKGVYANIDPIFGDEADGKACASLIRKYLPTAQIHMPDQAGFCRAVQSTWRKTTAKYVLNLEDDWLLNATITPEILSHFADDKLGQIAFNLAAKKIGFGGTGVRPSIGSRKRQLFGITLYRRPIPIFATSPSFLLGNFARAAAELLDTNLDPEKQFYNGLNPHLESFAFGYKALVYCLADRYVLTDIGRDWRAQRSIAKEITAGISSWTPTADLNRTSL